jgi:hypothetical protein
MSENYKNRADDLISNEACLVLDNLNSIIDSSSSIASISNGSSNNSNNNNKSASDYLNAARALKLNILNKKSKSFKKMSSSSNLNNNDPTLIKPSNSFQVKSSSTSSTNNQNETFINKENKFKSNSYLIKNNDNNDLNENDFSSYENCNSTSNNNNNNNNEEFINLFSSNHQSHHSHHHSTISGITNSTKLLSNININILPNTSSTSLLNKKKRSSLFNIFSFNRNSASNSNSQSNKPIINTNNKIANLSMMNINNGDANTNIDSNVSLEPGCKTFTRKRNLSGTTLENNNNNNNKSNLGIESKKEDIVETTKSDLDWHKSFRNLLANNNNQSAQKTHRTLSSSNLSNNSSRKEKQSQQRKDRFNSLIIPNNSSIVNVKHLNTNNDYNDVDFETCSTTSHQNNKIKYSSSFKSSTSNSGETNINKKPSIRSKGFSIPLNASFCLNPVPVHCLNNYTINNENLFNNVENYDDNLFSNEIDKDLIETNINNNNNNNECDEIKTNDNSAYPRDDQITASIVDINSFDLKESDHSCLKEFNMRLMKNKLNNNINNNEEITARTSTSQNLQETNLDNDDLSCGSNIDGSKQVI